MNEYSEKDFLYDYFRLMNKKKAVRKSKGKLPAKAKRKFNVSVAGNPMLNKPPKKKSHHK
ncbi:MAG: hypothetical protein ABIT08_14665 [Bacteroidia bacterium]